jgi:hypothetical protein
MHTVSIMIVGLAAATLAACGDSIRQSSASTPTVSYAYGTDDDPEDIASTADDYCDDTYGQEAVLLTRDAQGDRLEATYSCE